MPVAGRVDVYSQVLQAPSAAANTAKIQVQPPSRLPTIKQNVTAARAGLVDKVNAVRAAHGLAIMVKP